MSGRWEQPGGPWGLSVWGGSVGEKSSGRNTLQGGAGHSPVRTTTEAGVPSTPATWARTCTVYSVSGSSPSSSAAMASPETSWDFSGPGSGDAGSSRASQTLPPEPHLDPKETSSPHSSQTCPPDPPGSLVPTMA